MNRERKEAFLEERRNEAELGNNIEVWFREAEYFEDQYGHDLAEWTSNEIVTYLKYLSSTSVQTLTVCVNSLRIYADWCLVSGYLPNRQNHWYEITTESLPNYIDFKKFGRSIVTRKQLEEAMSIHKEINQQDWFLIWGIFEGIRIEDFKTIRYSMLEGNELNIPDRGVIKISDTLRDIIIKCRFEDEYISYSAGQTPIQYEDPDDPEDPTVYRQIAFKRGIARNFAPALLRRLSAALNLLGFDDVTKKTLQESGRLDFIENMDVGLHEALKTPYFLEHKRLYGSFQNAKIWEKTYGYFYKNH